ncbi:MAG TPA: ABC transporter ATP-binding protein [Clostridiaceae bacterium]|nr:ABC transporter ATP-binding protein [Clostridiaceae bacterium]
MSNIYDIDEEIKEQPFNLKLLIRTFKYISPYKKELILITFLLITSLAAGLLEPLFIKTAIDNGMEKGNFSVIMKTGFTLLGLYLVSFVSQRIRIKLINSTTQGMIYNIRKELFEHIQTLSFEFFDGRPVGKIMSRITNDVQAISDLVSGGLATLISESIAVIGILIIIFSLNFKLSLMAVSVLPILIFVLVKIKPTSERAWTKTRRTVAAINANLNETLQGIKVIQAFSREKHNIKKFEQINRDNYKANVRAIIIEMFIWPTVEMAGLLGSCFVIWYGARQVINGEQSIGTVVAFINYLWRFWAPLSAISKVYSQVLSAMASSERIFGILDTKPKIVDKTGAFELQEIEGSIVFDNVSFGYNPDEKMVLNNISFSVKPGEMVALVGPTGAGKTSIINLLMRFYDPIEGRILIDGYDIKDIKIASLRKQMGLVLQDSFLFSGTIMENIKYGKLDATEEEVMEAARATRVDLFVERFKDGYYTEIEERGAKLSSGQRQLLAFARALIAKPRILILDEATSSVDTETEKHIQDALKTLFEGRTSIVIAHRLSTIEHADKILVIDDGRIIEEGRHSELLQKKGKYYELYLNQFQDCQDSEEIKT